MKYSKREIARKHRVKIRKAKAKLSEAKNAAKAK
jgi:hypothetical protein